MLECLGKFFVLLGEFLAVAILFLFCGAVLCTDVGVRIALASHCQPEDETIHGREQSQENHGTLGLSQANCEAHPTSGLPVMSIIFLLFKSKIDPNYL